MNVIVKLELSDDDLRRVRAIIGRGGAATRSEVRVWVDRLVQGGLRLAPEPKRRQAKPVPPVRAAAPVDPLYVPQEVTDQTRCRHCQRMRESHGKMLLTCLPGFGAPVGSRFSPQWEQRP